ncbi:hypothetical protein RJ639_028274 [Escallonia herrerae]|uniref:NAB domain-containing protein n=1 Tax=Escallonia herrerae TaxID=1293975 RepID=A0AA88X5F4_9ASTE|nr:hypothetical protein RJ639_028274 [Escallonia herrerae]
MKWSGFLYFQANSHKHMRRMASKKSHSWWWDSHVSPKNSKWLAENLEDMDQSVKRMLKLIEEDGDSFAKKAEMYYQKRPELVSHVEEFYRMYRSLAERYDHVTGELRKNIPSDLQSQGSGISDICSEPASTWPSSDQKLSRRKSGPRAAGFDFFLGTGGSSSDLNKEGDETSTLDSESESDDSSINNYSGTSASGDDQGLRRKIIEMEVELRDVKEKLHMQQEENSNGSFRGTENVNVEVLQARLTRYEEELRVAKEKIRVSEEEIARLKVESQKYESMEIASKLQVEIDTTDKELERRQATELQENVLQSEISEPEHKIMVLEEELKVTKEKLRESEKEVAGLRHELESNGSSIRHLQDQLKSGQKDVSTWKVKLDKEKKEVSKLQDRIVRYKANLSDRDQEIRGLKGTVSNANKSLSEENSQLQAEMTKLLKERAYLEDNLKEWDLRCQSLEEDVRRARARKVEVETILGAEIEQLKAGIVERADCVEELNKSLEAFKLKHETLTKERDELSSKLAILDAEISSKDAQIDEMSKHLHELHIEHVELIAGAEKACRSMDELKSRVKDMEREVERQQELISEGAEEKREAIRQLCFSLDHYRNDYQRLRQKLVGSHRRLPVMAS